MQINTYTKTAPVLALMGVLFSGYIVFSRLLTKQCAFGETCPLFLGKPACWYGFGMFTLMFIIALLAFFRIINAVIAKRTILTISLVGIVFASQYAFPEFSLLFSGNAPHYQLGLPTCIWGFIFYILIFIVSAL